jgi:hypothetical protein
MPTIDAIVRSINRELTPQFEERLRAVLAEMDREWLIDQIVRLTLDAHSLEEFDRASELEARARGRADRLARVSDLGLDPARLGAWLEASRGQTRESLIAAGALQPQCAAKGGPGLTMDDRTELGESLLLEAKDVLYALLFGDAATNTQFLRTQHELLTLAVPRSKAGALDFMRAATELAAAGTWQDPGGVASDDRADNLLLEVQYGEIDEELVGPGIVACLSLINNLEINEQVLYARMINIEETTLIT